MRRGIIGVVLSLSLLWGMLGAAPAAQASQVFCRVPAVHKVVCYNYSAWSVHMYVTVRTAYGPRYFSFWNPYNRWTKYFVPVVYSVSWRWHY